MVRGQTDRVTMTGSAVAYDIGQNVTSITFKADGGTMKLQAESDSADGFPLNDGEAITLSNPNLGGRTVYLNGAGTVHVIFMYGTLA